MTRVQSVKLEVQGESYTIRSDAAAEHMREVATVVDAAIAKVRAGAPSLDPTRAAVLAAMQMADELLRARGETGALTSDIRALADGPLHGAGAGPAVGRPGLPASDDQIRTIG